MTDGVGGLDGLERIRVLVVDDEPDVCRMVARTLRGLSVDTVGGAGAATSAIAVTEYDVIVCDYSMPDASGEELYEAVCADKPQLRSRFIFMSGGAVTETAEVFLDGLRDAARLDKPFSPTQLWSKVRTCLCGRAPE